MFGMIRKETNEVFASLIQGVNPFAASKVGTNVEEVIGVFEREGIRIPILINYSSNGIDGTKVRIAYKKAIQDGLEVYAVSAVPEYFTTEKGVELILTKTLALFNLLSHNNSNSVAAEAFARAEVAALIERSLFMVNRYNGKEAKYNERRTCAIAKEQHKAIKEAAEPVTKKRKEKSGKPSLADISQQASQKVVDELLETEVPLATV